MLNSKRNPPRQRAYLQAGCEDRALRGQRKCEVLLLAFWLLVMYVWSQLVSSSCDESCENTMMGEK